MGLPIRPPALPPLNLDEKYVPRNEPDNSKDDRPSDDSNDLLNPMSLMSPLNQLGPLNPMNPINWD